MSGEKRFTGELRWLNLPGKKPRLEQLVEVKEAFHVNGHVVVGTRTYWQHVPHVVGDPEVHA